MAQIGLKHLTFAEFPVYDPQSPVAADVVPTYKADSGKRIGNIISANITWNNSNVKLFGDDRLVLLDNGANSGSIDIETTYLRFDLLDNLLGYTDGSNGEMKIQGKAAPYVGLGFISKHVDENGTDSYIMHWYYKVQFNMNNMNMRTREENTAYGVPTIHGEIFKINDSDGFGFMKTFATEAAALTALNSQSDFDE